MKYAVCYDRLEVFEDDRALRDFFQECYSMSEGAEQSRYLSVLINSAAHHKVAEDFVSDDCRDITIKNDKYSERALTIELKERKTIDDTVEYFEKIVQPILRVSEDYDIDFNNKIPFEDFDNDDVAGYGTMYSFSNYYKDILEKFNVDVSNIYTEDRSDGKYKITINDNHVFDTTAWESINGVIDNVESMLEVLKEKESEMSYE